MADNPFNDNPFNTNHANGTTSTEAPGAWNTEGAQGSAWATQSTPQTSAPSWGADVTSNAFSPPVTHAPVPVATTGELTEADLAKREKELNKREAELKRLELELRSSGAGGRKKNWPPFCSCTYHDIGAEIPEPHQRMVRSAYIAYLGLVVCLFFNWIGTAAILIGLGGDKLAAFLWGALYMVGGVPVAWFLWYRRLYRAAITDSAFQYTIFFAGFFGQLVFVGWSALAPPILNAESHTGYWEAIIVVGKNTGVGVMYFIGAALWTIEFFWSFWVLKLAYACFRNKGPSASPAAVQGSQGATWATNA